MKKCPPGVICIENFTTLLFIILIIMIGYFIYISYHNQSHNKSHNKSHNQSQYKTTDIIVAQPNYPYNNLYNNLYDNLRSTFIDNTPVNDVLTNPYEAPYRDERYFVPTVQKVPINISTNVGAVDTSYRQIGILTPLNGTTTNNILPLMGRPLYTNRQKWQYYTISNQHNNVKLPISVKGRSALNDYGVDELYNGDTVYVEGYNDAFKATVYENSTIKYLPFL